MACLMHIKKEGFDSPFPNGREGINRSLKWALATTTCPDSLGNGKRPFRFRDRGVSDIWREQRIVPPSSPCLPSQPAAFRLPSCRNAAFFHRSYAGSQSCFVLRISRVGKEVLGCWPCSKEPKQIGLNRTREDISKGLELSSLESHRSSKNHLL